MAMELARGRLKLLMDMEDTAISMSAMVATPIIPLASLTMAVMVIAMVMVTAMAVMDMVMDLARGKPTPVMAPSPIMPTVATAQCIGGFKDSMVIRDMAMARGRLSPAMAIVCIPTIPMVDMSLGMKT